MSLRHKDDWDEALDEAYENAVRRGEVKPEEPMEPGTVSDYGRRVVVRIDDIVPKALPRPKQL